MSLSSSNHGRQQSPSRSMRKTPGLALNQKHCTMPVSCGVGGLALPAYTGGRPLKLEQDRHDAARPGALAPGADWGESNRGLLHGRKNPAGIEVRA